MNTLGLSQYILVFLEFACMFLPNDISLLRCDTLYHRVSNDRVDGWVGSRANVGALENISDSKQFICVCCV